MIIYALLAVIAILSLMLGVSFFVIWKLVVNLSDKIALPLYDATGKRTAFIRPTPAATKAVKPEDQNLPRKESNYSEIDELPPEQLHAAIIGKTE